MLSKAGTVTALLAAASSFVSSVYAISKITRSGRYLYEEGGTRFYIKGIAYQEQGKHLNFLLMHTLMVRAI